MKLFDFLRGKPQEKTLEEIEEEKRRAQKTSEFRELISKFEYHDLENLCVRILGIKPPQRYEINQRTGERYVYPLNRFDYERFIMGGNFSLQQIKDFALKYQVVSPSFFGKILETDKDKKEFEIIINSIIAQFEPEKIRDEDHLQAQIAVFLKAKYPNSKVEREVITKSGDKLDIVVNDKFVFELKVYSDKNQLRNLGAQLEEYKMDYPLLCAIVLDTIRNETSELNIREYVDKYKVRHGIPTIVLYGSKRDACFST